MVTKSTHDSKLELFAPIVKNKEGKYIAVLSDNSVDRDDEMVSKECLEGMGKDDGYLAALCNHNNDVFMQVAEWTNRGLTEIDGHTALIAEPKFYKSNPNAMVIQGMLDEGAKLGVSIGAIIKDCDDINGRRVYKDLELVEASFVAVPSNRHGMAMAIAKSYNNKKKEDSEMELTQKDIDSAVEKAKDELTLDFRKQLETKDSEIVKLKKELEDAQSEAEKAEEESDKEKEEADKKLAEMATKAKSVEDALEAEKKKSLEKMNYANGNNGQNSPEDAEKAFKEGKLPVMRS